MEFNDKGWIKLYRILLDKPIWINSTPEQCKILVTLLLMANHEEAEWEWQREKFKIKPGQFITSLDSIVKKCGKGITTQNVRTALSRFEKLNFLTNESTKSGRLISIENWELYQCYFNEIIKDNNKDLTKNQQRPNKDLTPNKNDKNNKNVKNIDSDFEKEIISLYPGKKIKSVREKKLPKLLQEYGEEQIKRCVKRYAKECKDKKADKQFILNESTFWNGRYKDYLDPVEENKPKEKPKLNFVYRDL